MGLVEALRKYAEHHPKGGALILGALASFAAVAIIAQWGIDVEASVPSVTYILGVGFVLAIASALIADRLVMNVLKWFVVLIGIAWFFVFATDRVYPHNNDALACAARFWEPCRSVADNIAEDAWDANPDEVAEREAELNSVNSASTDLKAGDQPVFVMFAGFPRDDIRELMRSLAAEGWRVQGISGGGQRTPNAERLAEVRFGLPSDRNDAEMLAQVLQESQFTTKNVVAKQAPAITDSRLEVWISP